MIARGVDRLLAATVAFAAADADDVSASSALANSWLLQPSFGLSM